MSRYARKVDANQGEIVKALRDRGCIVDIVSHVPNLGFDVLVLNRTRSDVRAVEIKDGSKSPSACRLTESEERAMSRWGEKYAVVMSVAEALAMVEGMAE